MPLSPLNRICRIDGILDSAGRFRVLEANAVCPGGIAFAPRAHEIWRAVVGLPDGVSERAQPLLTDPRLFARSLVDCHREQFGRDPTTAVIVTLSSRYHQEVSEMIEDLQALGVDASTADARTIRLREDRVVDQRGRRVDLVYANVDQLDLITDPDLTSYLDAAVSGVACFVNPLLSQCIIGDKRALAIMWDPRFADYFNAAERALITEFIPATRLVLRDRDLLDLLERARDRLVLKPANRLCGEGVVIGPGTTPAAWRTALRRAAVSGAHVVQEYCPLPQLPGHNGLQLGMDGFVFNAPSKVGMPGRI
ncbi:circularly permuted type 2 ATP-grasp protein [Nocardia sp. SYP-A9097]|uniref:circularly permuted type 2 ATP-grasp protein n=1 Tax=Nocardia sp. SYP-A9097 TaxID=2663237 RepID=UPI001891B4E9|nr:circularly permuted type 2 ATP-grasp protein [Nocardia sp. SYP-A9097]